MTWATVVALAAVLAAALSLLHEERKHSSALRKELVSLVSLMEERKGLVEPAPDRSPDITSEWIDPQTGFLHTSDGRVFDNNGHELVPVGDPVEPRA